MLQDLDATLKAMLDDPAAVGLPAELRLADVSFLTPERTSAPDEATVNLFLFDVRENRELRDPVPIAERRGDTFVRRRPPLRVDCSYLVTTWSNASGPARALEEHRLLGQALAWLSRFPTIPPAYLQGSLATQPFPPPTLVAQMDGGKSVGEFWSALGIAPRPAFNLVVTIAMDLALSTDEPLVTTTIARYRQAADPATEETLLTIGGRVLSPAGDPVPAAWVRLEPLGQTSVAGEDGRFVFDRVPPGTGYTLRARAAGFGEALASTDAPSESGLYIVRFA